MKKVLSIVLSLVMVLCMMPVMAFAATTPTYNDIAGEKCEASVELLTELGVVDGYEDGSYKPAQTVTRAEMAKLIVTALGLNPTAGTTSFTDMANAQWAVPCVGYAESLGIINGYGDGRFGPNDLVTYDQAITMIVRALGYTTDCNEMQGVWPAVYVQKANELGILKDVNTTGSAGANRGDIAIMLANALDVQMVYADNDGATIGKTSADGKTEVTMYSTLVKSASTGYGTVTASDTANATKNINEFLGAAGKIVKNEDGDVISVSDIKSTFMTGEFSNNGNGLEFTVDNVDYTVKTDVLKELNDKGNAVTATSIPVFTNGESAGIITKLSDLNSTVTTGEELEQTTADKYPSLKYGQTVTIAATVSGKSISGIFSVQSWTGAIADKVTDTQLNQIDKNQKLLAKPFVKDDNGDVDTNTFILNGVDSLDEIAEDNIVAVYTNTAGYITKVEVGTEVVTGEITREYSDKITVDGKDYKFSKLNSAATINDPAIAPGNEVELYLDYEGKIYAAELVNGMAGNYAVVIDATIIDQASDSDLEGGLNGTTLKAKLIFADGTVKTVEANTSKLNKAGINQDDWNTIVASGNLITYELDSNDQLVDVEDVTIVDETANDKKVTSAGYFVATAGTYMISDNAAIFKINENTTDEADYSVVKKDSLLGVSKVKASYKLNDSNQIEVMVVTDSSDDTALYGILNGKYTNSDNDTVMNGFIGKDALTDAVLDSGTYATNVLVKLTKNGDGTYTIEEDIPEGTTIANSADQSVTVKSNTLYDLDGTYEGVLSSSVVVYVWDAKEEAYVVGTVDDINAAGSSDQIVYYKTADADDDDAGFITYVIVKPQA